MEAAAPRIVAVDGNETASTIAAIIERAKALGAMSESILKYLKIKVSDFGVIFKRFTRYICVAH
jgi:hypothetical protein